MVQLQARSPGAAPVLASRSARRPHVGAENVVPSTAVNTNKKTSRVGGGYPANSMGPPQRAQRSSTVAGRGNATALQDITNVAASRPLGKTGKAEVLAPMKAPVCSAAEIIPVMAASPVGAPFADAGDADDADSKLASPTLSEYAPEIFNMLFREEGSALPRANYMETQND